jgi:2-polyprenyl-3-methyl-5-hydroxy-6-metoxy-1,4-benzoquinol methylase
MDDRGVYQYYEDVNVGLLRLWGDRAGQSVLDVGCGFATTSKTIQERGNSVTGIEESAEAVVKARTRIGEVIEADLQNVDAIADRLSGRRFDAIILADVLEHLPWPGGILRSYLRFLKDDGTVIISLPNVGLWSVRLNLLAGRFQYQDTGVLDRTHLRFFTRRSARELIDSAGLEVVKTVYNPGLVRPFVPLLKKVMSGKGKEEGQNAHDPEAILNSPAFKLYLKGVHPIESGVARLWPSLLAFQMVFEARRR